jgi:hypothetical protein
MTVEVDLIRHDMVGLAPSLVIVLTSYLRGLVKQRRGRFGVPETALHREDVPTSAS